MITRAIIPVAGWGTRRLPITKSIEKCMLPIGNRPLVDYVVQDCIKAGIREIYFVVSEGSTQLRTYYSHNHELNDYLTANGKAELIESVAPPHDVTFRYVVQPTGKYGTAVPVALAAVDLSPGESAIVLMGDDFVYNEDGSSEVARLIEATPDGGSAMLGVNVPREDVGRYGVIESDDANRFVRIVEKPAPDEAPSTLINVSKYVLSAEALRQIALYAEADREGEYYITDPINEYVNNGGVMQVVPAQGEYLDGGTLEGWLHANNVVCSEA